MLDFPALTAQLVSAEPRRDTPPFFYFVKVGGEILHIPTLFL
jgi:hypothetical protein